jgi:holo-[acyl-carrier protein] synthase
VNLLSYCRRLGHRAASLSAPHDEPGLRVGIDLVHVGVVSDTLLSSQRERYLDRIYTPAEITACRTSTGIDPLKLAARFAAKEATMKMLGVGDRPAPWGSIELCRGADGRPSMNLRGAAKIYAREASVKHIAVSLSHDGEYATAVVVGSGS